MDHPHAIHRVYNGRTLTSEQCALFGDIDRFYRTYGHLHAARMKHISRNSQRERRRLLYQVALDFHRMGRPVQKLGNISARDIAGLLRYWEGEERSPTYLQNHASALRFACQRLGRGNVFPEKPARLLENPERWVRRQRKVEYTPEAMGADLESVIAWLTEQDPVVGHIQRLKLEFGLRVQEAVMFRALEADRGDHLLIGHDRGPKNGRPRCITVLDFVVERVDPATGRTYIRDVAVRPSAIELLAESKRLSSLNISGDFPHGTLIPTYRSKLQGMEYERYLVRRAGMTKKKLGFTSHSLRHAYAARRYEAHTAGIERAWNREGALETTEQVSRERAVRQLLAVQLGHNDPTTTATYAGPVTEVAPRKLNRLLRRAVLGGIKEPILRITKQGQAVPGRGLDVVIINPWQVGNLELLDRDKLE